MDYVRLNSLLTTKLTFKTIDNVCVYIMPIWSPQSENIDSAHVWILVNEY